MISVYNLELYETQFHSGLLSIYSSKKQSNNEKMQMNVGLSALGLRRDYVSGGAVGVSQGCQLDGWTQ